MQIFIEFFYEGHIKQLISYMLFIFNPFKITVQFFKTASNFPNFDDSNAFFNIQQVPGLKFRKVGKSRDENSQPFSIRKICQLTPKWRKAILESLIKGL